MRLKSKIFVTDIDLEHFNSTRKLVVDLINCLDGELKNDITFIFARSKLNRSTADLNGVDIIEIWTPFYKNKSIILRLISEIIFTVCVILLMLIDRLLVPKCSKSLSVVSPSMLAAFVIMISAMLNYERRLLIQRDLFYRMHQFRSQIVQFIYARVSRKLMALSLKYCSDAAFENDFDKDKISTDFNIDSRKLKILYNWYKFDEIAETKRVRVDKKYRKAIYAGSVSDAQGYENICKFLRASQVVNLKIDFYAYGRRLEELKNFCVSENLRNVSFNKVVSQHELDKLMKTYDFGLFFLATNPILHNFPGKLLGYLSNNMFILGVTSRESFSANFIARYQIGSTLGSNDLEAERFEIKFKRAVELKIKMDTLWFDKAKRQLDAKYAVQFIFGETCETDIE